MNEKKIVYYKNTDESRIKYHDYINNHIKLVQEVYYRSIEAFEDVFPDVYINFSTISELIENLRHHDSSKTSFNEFWPYALRFFPTNNIPPELEKFKGGFDLAWLHHANSNPHHPAYWVLADNDEIKIFDMPDIYIIEMLCDWMAMSKYYNSTTLEYWKSESAQKLPMSDYTKSKVNEFMDWMLKNNVHILW